MCEHKSTKHCMICVKIDHVFEMALCELGHSPALSGSNVSSGKKKVKQSGNDTGLLAEYNVRAEQCLRSTGLPPIQVLGGGIWEL